MEGRHASLGRRTLEEIRQKRAAEKLSRASSGPDLPNPHGMPKSKSGNRIDEINGLEQKNAELEDENKKLLSKLEAKEVENDTLLKRLRDLEDNSFPSLQKALRDVQMEKDAAIVAREDLVAQLRTLKKRVKEAEEEQYRAEEDAASLRAEINSLHQQVMGNPLEHIQAMEKEIADLKSMLEQESVSRQLEQQKLTEEKKRSSDLMAEREDLEGKLAALSKKVSDEAVEDAARKAYSLQDKEKQEKQLHDMAVMVERLESSRQKLLMEIDSQSAEIERLFEENSNLSASCEDAMGLAVQWENQVKDCLKQNEELRSLLDKLRMEQASKPYLIDGEDQSVETEKVTQNASHVQAYAAENLPIKVLLAREQSRAEALSAEVLRLSAELKHAVQAYNSVTHFYKPVLQHIEKNLINMKQGSFVQDSIATAK